MGTDDGEEEGCPSALGRPNPLRPGSGKPPLGPSTHRMPLDLNILRFCVFWGPIFRLLLDFMFLNPRVVGLSPLCHHCALPEADSRCGSGTWPRSLRSPSLKACLALPTARAGLRPALPAPCHSGRASAGPPAQEHVAPTVLARVFAKRITHS